MSGSPKYSLPRLTSEQERRLREARREQAERERKRRQQARLNRARVSLEAQLDAVEEQLERFAASAGGPFLDHQSTGALKQQIQDTRAAMSSARDESELRGPAKQLRQLRRACSHLIGQAECNQRADEQDRLRERLRQLKHDFLGDEAELSMQFDRAGFSQINQTFDLIESRLQGRRDDRVEGDIQQLQQRIERHRREVEVASRGMRQQRQRCDDAIEKAEAAVADLREDDTAMRWLAKEVDGLQRRLEAARREREKSNFDSATSESAEIETAAQQVSEKTQERQLQQERRDFIVNGIIDIMEQ
ncbi:MAG: hypothetical protein MI861_03965, partial [Pirellulales bacterium]|nr:hypothetical protein [Pirellulales bacterium]